MIGHTKMQAQQEGPGREPPQSNRYYTFGRLTRVLPAAVAVGFDSAQAFADRQGGLQVLNVGITLPGSHLKPTGSLLVRMVIITPSREAPHARIAPP